MRTTPKQDPSIQREAERDAYRRFPLQIEKRTLIKVIRPHFHDFFEIDAVVSGTGINCVENERAEFVSGDLLLGNPFEQHEIISISPQIISVKFGAMATGVEGPEQASLLEPFLSKTKGFRVKLTFPPPQRQVAFATLEWMARAPVTETSRIYFHGLLTLIREEWNQSRKKIQMEKTLPPHPLPLQVMSYIDSHFDQDLKIPGLAKTFDVSPSRLNALFQRTIGQSVKSYLGARRLTFARDCLSRGAGVSEAAARSGFNDVSVFYRAFTKATGVSPRDYVNKKI